MQQVELIAREPRLREHLPLVQGKGRYIDDVKLSNCVYAAIVRSTYAHARISEIDKGDALAVEGVIGVVDHADISKLYNPPRLGIDPKKQAIYKALADEKVRYVGEPVAVVVATSKASAEDGAERVVIKYQGLSPVVDPVKSVDSKDLLYDGWGSNVAFYHQYEQGDAEELLHADFVFEETITMQRHSGTPIEPRGMVADYNRASGELVVYSTTPIGHMYRSYVANILGLDENKVRVISGNIGGAYGNKTIGYQEDLLIPLVSIIFERPVKWIETRMESFSSTVHGREQVHRVKIGVKRDGTILGIKNRIVVNLGAYPSRTGPIEAFNAAGFLPGCYKFQNYSFELYGVVTNKTPMGPYRGFGKSGPGFVIERVMDIVARKLKMDPAGIRKVNFVESFPFRNAAGAVYDSGSYFECLKLALEKLDYESARRVQLNARRDGRYIGIGLSSSISPSGIAVKDEMMSPFDAVTIRVGRQGKVLVLSSACGMIGTNHDSIISQVVSDELGATQSDVSVFEGDTNSGPVGTGTYSDRTAVYTVSAAKLAAKELKQKLLEVAGSISGESADKLGISNSQVVQKSSGKPLTTIRKVAQEFFTKTYEMPRSLSDGLEVTYCFWIRDISFFPANNGRIYYPTFGNGCDIAVVEVDPESGRIKILKYIVAHDCGRILNKTVVEGQVRGGIVAGVGGSIYEEMKYDDDGQLLASSFSDYLIPTSLEAPSEIEVYHVETPSPLTPLGTKGVGESGTIGVYGAIANAVEDALSPFGVSVDRLPLSPEYIRGLVAHSSQKN